MQIEKSEKTKLNLDLMRKEVKKDIINSYNNFMFNRNLVNASREKLQEAEQNFETIKNGFKIILNDKNVKSAIVLRKNPYKLLDIYEKRGYAEKKRKDNLGSEILGIITNDTINSFGQERTFQIDVSEYTPKEVVSRIDNILDRDDAGDNIDWLPLIQEKNDFKTFFEY